MEIIGSEGDPVVPVINVGVRVMPGPVYKFHCHYVIRDVNQNRTQTNGKGVGYEWESKPGYAYRGGIYECGIYKLTN